MEKNRKENPVWVYVYGYSILVKGPWEFDGRKDKFFNQWC